MSKYILKRLVISLLTLLVIIFVLFLMLDLMPGSPFNDEKLTEAQKIALYAKYGLDQPFFIRFLKYLQNMLHGDLGVSYVINKNRNVTETRFWFRSASARRPWSSVRFSDCCWVLRLHFIITAGSTLSARSSPF